MIDVTIEAGQSPLTARTRMYLSIIPAALVVVVVFMRWSRRDKVRRGSTDALGAMSMQWVAEHRASYRS